MSDVAVVAEGAGKVFRLFRSKFDRALDAAGLSALTPWRPAPREHWALRDLSFEVPRGRCLGVVGRNGAGKTTLLRLLTGSLAPSEGRVTTTGRVHGLMDAGAGFHPEFTGRENLRASLTFQGLGKKEIASAERDIAEFTALGDALDEPVRTYSLGMWTRLAFATATVLRPDVLVVDEVLGAGDASFTERSHERLRAMTRGGGTMVVASHSLGQITQLCADAIWIEGGRLVMKGEALEVVKAYTRFIHEPEQMKSAALSRRVDSMPAAWSRWSGEGSLEIVDLQVRGGDGQPRQAFAPDDAWMLEFTFKAKRADVFDVKCAVVIFRDDGIRITLAMDDWRQFTMDAGETRTATLTFDRLNLGNGNYAVSVALYKEFAADATRVVAYDWLDRSVYFHVDGVVAALNTVFVHPSSWSVS